MAWLLSNQTLGFLFQPLEIWRIWNWPLRLTSSKISATKQRTQWHWCCGALSPEARMVCQTSEIWIFQKLSPFAKSPSTKIPWLNKWSPWLQRNLVRKTQDPLHWWHQWPGPNLQKNTQMTTKGKIHTDSMENNTPNNTPLWALWLCWRYPPPWHSMKTATST